MLMYAGIFLCYIMFSLGIMPVDGFMKIHLYSLKGVCISMKKITILDIPFVDINQKEFVSHLDQHVEVQEKAFIVTANPEVVMKAKKDTDFMHILQQATYITADGIGIVKAAEMLGTPLPGRVTGYDTAIALLQIANQKHYKIYLLGAAEETLNKTVHNIQVQYPNIEITGYHHGFFDWDHNGIAEDIAEQQPDIIFVALGVPRQERWIAENFAAMRKGVFIGVGGTFDVIAGTVKRAPNIWIKLNIEWLYRLLSQPSRLIRMLDLPKFVWRVFREKRKRRKS